MEDRTLKPAQVAVLMMRAVELLDWPEIAELSGLSRDAVRYHYMQGLRRLRERYRGMMA
ncbi:sigma factor-like helix-turn-helix DNA-binding protein [Alicyclobacillus macrosporangiidus]|nr:sigma factor-like helix-turn-helix DNA-binding protein [Alicyclobacillus macrosporangiidus]